MATNASMKTILSNTSQYLVTRFAPEIKLTSSFNTGANLSYHFKQEETQTKRKKDFDDHKPDWVIVHRMTNESIFEPIDNIKFKTKERELLAFQKTLDKKIVSQDK